MGVSRGKGDLAGTLVYLLLGWAGTILMIGALLYVMSLLLFVFSKQVATYFSHSNQTAFSK